MTTSTSLDARAASPGTMLREARERSQQSQTDLARRAGVAQSVISAYESDRREPSLRTLTKLIEACGHQLVIDLRPTFNHPLGLPNTERGRQLRRHRKAIIDCATRRGGSNVRVFGSVARGDDTDASDIDMLVDLGEGMGLLDLIGLSDDLTDLLGTKVDVVPASSLKPGVRSAALAEAIQL